MNRSRSSLYGWLAFAAPVIFAMLLAVWQRWRHGAFWRSLASGEDNAAGALMAYAEMSQLTHALALGAVIGCVLGWVTIMAGRRKLGYTAVLANCVVLCLAAIALAR